MSFFSRLWDKIRRLFGRKKRKSPKIPPEIRPQYDRASDAAKQALQVMGIVIRNVTPTIKLVPAERKFGDGWSVRCADSPTGWAGGITQGGGSIVTMPHNPANKSDITIGNLAHELGWHVYAGLPDSDPRMATFHRLLGKQL